MLKARLWILVVFSVCMSQQVARGDLIFDDGANHVVNSTVNDFVVVANGPGAIPTVVTFQASADITGTDPFDDTVFSLGTSTINVQGGSFQDDVSAYQRSNLNISGGNLNDDVIAFNRATLTISGGTIADDVELFDRSSGIITGGTFGEDIEVFGGSLEISGGTFFTKDLSDLDTGIGVGGNGQLTLIGRSFQINGMNVGSGLITPTTGTLSGVLLDGSTFSNIPFTRNLNGNNALGTFQLTAVPEPSTWLCLAGLGAAMNFRLRCRRRQS